MATNDDPRPVIDNRPGNGGSRPVPDPTALTDAAIAKAVEAMTSYVDGKIEVRDERLRGIDVATKLNFDSVAASRQAIIDRISDLDRLIESRFVSFEKLEGRTAELGKDALNVAFSASKEAVAAAFAAQKEDANRRDEGNQKAIDKSERATADTIKTNQESNKITTDALVKTLDEVKQAITRIESTKIGATENRTGLYAAIGIVGTILGILIAVYTVIAILKP